MALKYLPSGIRLSNDSLYKSLNLLQLKDIHELERAMYMHRVQQGTIHPYPFGPYLPDIFKQKKIISTS